MEVTLRKYGNSTVVVIPPSILRELGVSAGQAMNLRTTDEGGIALDPKLKYSLRDLIGQCDLKAAPPADLAAWDSAKPTGGEVW